MTPSTPFDFVGLMNSALDETILAYLAMTQYVLDAVEQEALSTACGGWLADEILRRFFD